MVAVVLMRAAGLRIAGGLVSPLLRCLPTDALCRVRLRAPMCLTVVMARFAEILAMFAPAAVV